MNWRIDAGLESFTLTLSAWLPVFFFFLCGTTQSLDGDDSYPRAIKRGKKAPWHSAPLTRAGSVDVFHSKKNVSAYLRTRFTGTRWQFAVNAVERGFFSHLFPLGEEIEQRWAAPEKKSSLKPLRVCRVTVKKHLDRNPSTIYTFSECWSPMTFKKLF